MYKILLLTRDSSTQPLWTPYRISQILEEVEIWVDFETGQLPTAKALGFPAA